VTTTDSTPVEYPNASGHQRVIGVLALRPGEFLAGYRALEIRELRAELLPRC